MTAHLLPILEIEKVRLESAGSDGGFTLTLWVETDSEPDTAYYDQLA